jgi:hypothetical protein
MMELKIKALKAGAILKSSCGYDQTNVDFYVVTKGATVGKMIEIQQINSHIESVPGQPSMSGRATVHKVDGQVQLAQNSKPMKKKLNEQGRVKVRSFAWARLWDGEAAYVSWYA